jgi:hypothetical protein
LLKNAINRGIDPKALADTAKSYNLTARCAKSVHAPPKKRFEIAKKKLLEQREHTVPYDKQI